MACIGFGRCVIDYNIIVRAKSHVKPLIVCLTAGGGGAASSCERPRGEAGDAKDEANGGQGQTKGAGEAQDPIGAAAGVEEQDAGATGRTAEATQRSQESERNRNWEIQL